MFKLIYVAVRTSENKSRHMRVNVKKLVQRLKNSSKNFAVSVWRGILVTTFKC